MRLRWTLAILGALALAVLTMSVPLPWVFRAAAPPAGAACPADAKTAKLDFTLKDMNGNNVRLSDYRGKVILLDFWATWCGPCKVEIPSFVELQNKYGKDGLQVIGVSVDDTLEKLTPYVKELKMNYPVLLGLGHDDVQDAYGPIFGIPVNVVISRDGKICAKHAGMSTKEQFEKEIRSLL
jgi:peroxiredoxin